MIFVTAGTTSFPFIRLDKIVSDLRKIYPKEKIIYQNPVLVEKISHGVICLPLVGQKEFAKYLKTSEFVIGHAGFATVMQSLKYSKPGKLAVIPRLSKYKEHVNDHQLYFAKYMERRGLIAVIDSAKEIKNLMKKARKKNTIKNYLQTSASNKKRLINFLNSLTET